MTYSLKQMSNTATGTPTDLPTTIASLSSSNQIMVNTTNVGTVSFVLQASSPNAQNVTLLPITVNVKPKPCIISFSVPNPQVTVTLDAPTSSSQTTQVFLNQTVDQLIVANDSCALITYEVLMQTATGIAPATGISGLEQKKIWVNTTA